MLARIALTSACALAVGCTSSTPNAGECAANRDCPAGSICSGGTCKAICATQSDCPAGQVCQEGTCVQNPGGGPSIGSIVGNDANDPAFIADAIIVTGTGLGDASFTISDGATLLAISLRTQTVTRAELVLPADVRSGTYTLTATNGVGSDQAAVTLTLPELTGNILIDRINTTGTTAITTARLQIGTSAGTVAAGDHSHSGPVEIGRLPVGTGPGQVAAGDHRHFAANLISVVRVVATGAQSGAGASRQISVNGTSFASASTGLQLVVLDSATHAPDPSNPFHNLAYDTSNAANATNLAGQLDQLAADDIVILASNGPVRNVDVPVSGNPALTLAKAIQSVGGTARIWTIGTDDAYVLIGRPGLGHGSGHELIMNSSFGNPSAAVLLLDREVVGAAAPPPAPSRGTYTQWGASSCTNATADPLYAGWAFVNYYTHSGSADPLCLQKAQSTGAAQSYTGDLLYPAAINGGAVHQGIIQDDRRIQCAHCMARRGSCFINYGSNACPNGFDRQYEGYLYGSHYTHAAPYTRICVDHLNFDNTLTNSPNSGGHFYPTRVHSNATTDVPLNNGVRCAVCCGG